MKRLSAGFSLIEILVAITISGIVLSAVMVSYVSMTRASQKIDLARQMQKELNFAMIRFADRVRAESVGYSQYEDTGPCATLTIGEGMQKLCLTNSVFELDPLLKKETSPSPETYEFLMNGESLFSEKFDVLGGWFRVSPEKDPAKIQNPQFQPRVQIYLKVGPRDGSIAPFEIQTTISSRLYQ